MENSILQLMREKDYDGLRKALESNPALVNEEITINEESNALAHPLHRICDGVFSGAYTDEEAVQMAGIFLDHGAKIDGNGFVDKQETPLIAAASLYADLVAILYIDQGANIHHAGCHGGTALHWAAWCGRPLVVSRLLEAGAEVNKLCIDFQGTPLSWAKHGMNNGQVQGSSDYQACIKLLEQAGGA